MTEQAPVQPEGGAVPQTEPISIQSSGEAEKARVPPAVAGALTDDALRLLSIIGKAAPDLLRLIKQVRGEKLFHVVMEGNVEDLKKAGHGLLHAWRKVGRHFKEQALLREVTLGPESLAALSDLATKAMLVELAINIDAVHADVRRVGELVFAAEKGRLRGMIVEFSTIHTIKDDTLRQNRLNMLAHDIAVQTRAAIDMLKIELDRMPDAKANPIRDGWNAGEHQSIATQWKCNGQTLALILEGMRVATWCHLELGERDAALHAFEGHLKELEGLHLSVAAEKARLAPYDPKDPPEAIWERGVQLIQRANKRLDDYRAGTLLLDFSPEVFGNERIEEL